jgi:3'-5' exoribonuclease
MASAAIASSPDEQTIATLRCEDDVDGVFACVAKERQLSRAGTPYLTVTLRDRTGAMVARAFRDADLLAGRFERGELVRVRGRVERFRGELQVALRSIARAEHADPARFLPVAYRDLDELEGFLEHLAREVYDPGLRGTLESVLGDAPLRAQLRRAPCTAPGPGRDAPGARRTWGAARGHHAYLGGLLEHTVAVTVLASELCALHPRLDRDLLLAAAIVHDLGKTREFLYAAEVTPSAEGRLLGHVELGLRVLSDHLPAPLSGERRLALEHCVIMHHGPEAAGGQRFASPEALALYRVNALDAQLKGALERGLS